LQDGLFTFAMWRALKTPADVDHYTRIGFGPAVDECPQ